MPYAPDCQNGMHIYGRGAKQKSGNRMDAALKVVSPRIELGSNL